MSEGTIEISARKISHTLDSSNGASLFMASLSAQHDFLPPLDDPSQVSILGAIPEPSSRRPLYSSPSSGFPFFGVANFVEARLVDVALAKMLHKFDGVTVNHEIYPSKDRVEYILDLAKEMAAKNNMTAGRVFS